MKNTLKFVLRIIAISLVISLVTGIPFIKAQSNNSSGNTLCYSVKKDSSWLYLGQTPPGMIPERFPPDSLLGNSIWFWHGSPVFSPDGKELFMPRLYIGVSLNPLIYSMEVIDEEWTAPAIPNFCGNYSANSPSFSVSGDSLFFISERPYPSVYFTTKSANNWSDATEVIIPKPSQSYFGNSVSIAKDGTLYFELTYLGNDDLYKSELVNGQYSEAINLGTAVNSNEIEFGVYIDPDEEYIIFSSLRSGGYGYSDMYISTKDSNGNWTDAQNLGSEINSETDDAGPWVSSDGLYFFFNTQKEDDEGYNPYWVDIGVLDPFIVSVEESKKSEIIFKNYPNPFTNSTNIEYKVIDHQLITIQIIDLHGKLVRTLVDGLKSPGIKSVPWDGADIYGRPVSNGIYYCVLKIGNNKLVRNLVKVK